MKMYIFVPTVIINTNKYLKPFLNMKAKNTKLGQKMYNLASLPCVPLFLKMRQSKYLRNLRYHVTTFLQRKIPETCLSVVPKSTCLTTLYFGDRDHPKCYQKLYLRK